MNETVTNSTLHPASIDLVLDRLRDEFGDPERANDEDPVSGLISTILSQNTTDANTDRAFKALRAAFPSWEEVVAANTVDVANAIRVGGLADQKAPRIQAVLRAIHESQGVYNLDFLADAHVEEARSWLIALPGVGPKTAACVLLFNLDKNVLPVDTHVHRVSRRLGWIPEKLTAEQAQPAIERIVAPSYRYAAHMLLIWHGRKTCKARAPRCPSCILADICPSRDTFMSS